MRDVLLTDTTTPSRSADLKPSSAALTLVTSRREKWKVETRHPP